MADERWQQTPSTQPVPITETPDEPTSVKPPITPSDGPLRSVASVADEIEAAQPKPPQHTPKPEPSGDPLLSESVTAGLNQLLTEWNLFKGGGILGSGPKGAEHPLYKELKNLPMNLVIAGRFEGATPEVKQSIHDYMNGWRYEQGMTHDLQETFEHYLRRVVKTIIDKQAKSS
jgi:hypothetical protein